MRGLSNSQIESPAWFADGRDQGWAEANAKKHAGILRILHTGEGKNHGSRSLGWASNRTHSSFIGILTIFFAKMQR
jgi:hypothetical protein